MDIPETGAIFSLGKSHLVENNQSYFFVKNDPVKRLVSGPNQSAVICGSGRLFVWGENQFGQLATGDGEPPDDNNDSGGGGGDDAAVRVVRKPTCVKTLKAMGLKVVDISFGQGWSVILTNSNEIYFAGRSIFPETWASRQQFSTMDVGSEKFAVAEKIIALQEFSRVLKGEDIQGIVAGNDHFAVLTSTGKLFAWGRNDMNQIGQYDSALPEPIDIDVGGPIKKVVCGPKSTLILTADNRLYLTGTLSDFQYPRPTEINLNYPRDEIIDMQITYSSEIYLVTGTGDIYKSVESARSNSLSFTKFYDYDQDEKGIVVKLMKGNSFFVALTRAKKLFTTFSESGHHLKTFREISKFKNLKILDFAVGERHVLVLGVPKVARSVESSCRNLNTASTPARANIVANGYAAMNGVLSQHDDYGFREIASSKSQGGDQPNIDEENANISSPDQIVEVKHVKQMISSPNESDADNDVHVKDNNNSSGHENNNTNSILPIEEAHSPVQPDQNKHEDDTPKPQTPGVKSDQSEEKSLSAPSLIPTAGSSHSRRGSARSIRFDESTIIVHTKSTEKLDRPQTPYPDPSISPKIRKTSISSVDDINLNGTPTLTDSLEHISENSQDSTEPPQTERRASLKYSDRGLTDEQIQEITRVISAKVPVPSGDKFILLDDDEDFKVEIALNGGNKQNEILFINDGIDVTKSVERLHKDIEDLDQTIPETALMIIKTPKQLEPIRTQQPKTILHVLGEESLAEVVDEKMVKDLKQMTQEDIMSLNGDDDLNQTESTSKDDSNLKTSRGEDDERTTASVSSNIVVNNFENDDSADDSRNKDSNSPPNTNDSSEDVDPVTKKQKVRRFLNDLKTKGREMSCKNDHSVRVEDEPPKYSLSDNHDADQKTSKVCTIL